MNNRGNFNLGDEIRNIVQDAVNNRDFNRLNQDIGNFVNGALDEARRSTGRNRYRNNSRNNPTGNNTWDWKVSQDQNNNSNSKSDNSSYSQQQSSDQYRSAQSKYSYQQSYSNGKTNQNPGNRSYQNKNQNTYQNSNSYNQSYAQNKPVPAPVKSAVPVGQVSGVMLSVFGSLGSVVFAIAAILFVVKGFFVGNGMIYDVIAAGLLPCFIASNIMSIIGSRTRKRLKRFERYLSQLHGRNYCLIKDFSSVTGRSDKYTVRDLQKMIDIGMFPEGHLDDKMTCFMLNSESYQQYLNLQEQMRMKNSEDQAKNANESTDRSQQDNKNTSLDPVIRKAVEEGRQFVQKIRLANIAIPGEEISRKLDRLELVTGKIYDYVELHPEKFPEIKKFTEYFLPTTLKLLDAYREFEYQPVEGENISTAKKEIEDTMDTINLAFENLLDGLFEDAAMDISTDISVLHTMFAQEGLTEKSVKN